MRIGFIGGNGHHKLTGLLRSTSGATERFEAAISGDGHDDDAARRFAGSLPGAAWHDDPEAMLDHFKPDVVSIGAVYGYNGEMIALTLERGIPVVSDKPIAANRAQLDRLTNLTQRPGAGPGAPIVTEFEYRTWPAFIAARQAVQRGDIGRVVLCTSQKSYRFGDARPAWYADRASYGGTLLWVASHAIDWTLFVTGLRFTRVDGRAGNLSRPTYGTMEDHTVSLFDLEGGGAAIVHADYLRPKAAASHGDDRMRIAGTRGIIEIRGDQCLLTTHDQPEHAITPDSPPAPIAQQLLDAALGNSAFPFGTAESLRTAEILLQAQQAADERRAIDLTSA